jgi:hypothetical protein
MIGGLEAISARFACWDRYKQGGICPSREGGSALSNQAGVAGRYPLQGGASLQGATL